MNCEGLGTQEGYRYIIKCGKFGIYFWDNKQEKQMPLIEVCRLLNEYYDNYCNDHVIYDATDAEMIAGGWIKNKNEIIEQLFDVPENVNNILKSHEADTEFAETIAEARDVILHNVSIGGKELKCPACKIEIKIAELAENIGLDNASTSEIEEIYFTCPNCYTALILKKHIIGLRE